MICTPGKRSVVEVKPETASVELKLNILVIAVLVACPLWLSAADGDLDPAFGSDGVVLTQVGLGSSAAYAVSIQPDGKIVVGGNSALDFAVVRYHPDGSLDPGFGVGGIVLTRFGQYGSVSDLLIQPDGKIVVCGQMTVIAGPIFTHEWAIARYNPDGSLDTSFDDDGMVTTAFGTYNNFVRAIALQSDGKIVAAGSIVLAGSNRVYFGLGRLTPDGRPDDTFGEGGIVFTDFATGAAFPYDAPMDVVLQSDGKIVLAGVSATDTIDRGRLDFAVARYNPDGALDPEFGNNGLLVTDFDHGMDSAEAVTLTVDGRLVVAGTAHTGEVVSPARQFDFAVARYLPDGSLDADNFGNGGLATSDLAGQNLNDYALAALVQHDLKIVLVGYTPGELANSLNVALVRFLPDGNIDNGFGENGVVTTTVNGEQDTGHAAALQDDGNIVVVGTSWTNTGSTFLVIRYLSAKNIEDAVDDLAESVRALMVLGTLSEKDGSFLLRALDRTVDQIEKDNVIPAINQLWTFIHRIEMLLDRGELPSEIGQELIDAAQEIIDRLIDQ